MRRKDEYTSSDMLEIVKQRGYFEIRLIPNHNSKLSVTGLEGIIRKNQVKHRRMLYPHIADHKYGKFQKGDNYIESFYDWRDVAEIWRFYKSGQFKHFRGFIEDGLDTPSPRFSMPMNLDGEITSSENTFFEPVVKIWEMTEIFLFASRLANELNCELIIEIKLHMMAERQLQMRVVDRVGLIDDYTCHTPTITLEPISISSEELQLKHDELAAKKILEIFGHFGWDVSHMPPSIIKEEQEKFYSHGF